MAIKMTPKFSQIADDRIKFRGGVARVSTVRSNQFGYYETCVFVPGEDSTIVDKHTSEAMVHINHRGWVGRVKLTLGVA